MISLLVTGCAASKENSQEREESKNAVSKTESSNTAEKGLSADNTAESTGTAVSVSNESLSSDDASNESTSSADNTDNELPDVFPMKLSFCSGAGAWSTDITMQRDGTFTGNYEDVDIDSWQYSEISYYCDFKGKFYHIKRMNQYSWSMDLEYLTNTTKKPVGSVWVENNIEYHSEDPYGMEEGKKYIFYSPDTPTEGLPEDFLAYWPCWRFFPKDADLDHPEEWIAPKTLSCYGLLNQKMGYGFFACNE